MEIARTQRATPFFEGQSAAYAEQMLSAASYCHQRGECGWAIRRQILGLFFDLPSGTLT
jgi:hypothetical protein